LRDLLEQLDFKENPMRKAAAWFSEKIAPAKLSMEDPAGEKLARLEKLEALTLGIEGKRALWRSLSVIGDRAPALQAMDLTRLERRAAERCASARLLNACRLKLGD
jgi:hypothetical protein